MDYGKISLFDTNDKEFKVEFIPAFELEENWVCLSAKTFKDYRGNEYDIYTNPNGTKLYAVGYGYGSF